MQTIIFISYVLPIIIVSYLMISFTYHNWINATKWYVEYRCDSQSEFDKVLRYSVIVNRFHIIALILSLALMWTVQLWVLSGV